MWQNCPLIFSLSCLEISQKYHHDILSRVSNFIYRTIVTKLCRQLGLTKQSHSGVGYEDMSKPKSWWLEETLLNQRFFVLANLEDAWKRKIKPKSQLFCHNYSQPISLILSFLILVEEEEAKMQNGISRNGRVSIIFCICFVTSTVRLRLTRGIFMVSHYAIRLIKPRASAI